MPLSLTRLNSCIIKRFKKRPSLSPVHVSLQNVTHHILLTVCLQTIFLVQEMARY